MGESRESLCRGWPSLSLMCNTRPRSAPLRERLRLRITRARRWLTSPPRRVGIANDDGGQGDSAIRVPTSYAEEMKATVITCRDRASEVEDDDEDNEHGVDNALPDGRNHREVRQFSSEFLVKSELLQSNLNQSAAKERATVHELTKAKLLTYYARRDDTSMRAAGHMRRRHGSATEVEMGGAAEMAARDADGSFQVRSGTLRAARTQRLYSEPPTGLGGSDSFSSVGSASFAAPSSPRLLPRKPLPPLARAPRSPGAVSEGSTGSNMATTPVPGVPHFRPASNSQQRVAAS